MILCNVGAVVLWDPQACARVDRGANFYVTEGDVEERTSRAAASVGELRSLNPYCRVVVLADVASGALGGEDGAMLNRDVLGQRGGRRCEARTA